MRVGIWILVGVCLLLTAGFVSGTTYVVDDDAGRWRDYSTIQDAEDVASDGDTILVYAGTYNERVSVDVEVMIQGNGSDVVTVNGGGNGDVFYVTADNVDIDKMTITNSGNTTGYAGIELYNADDCEIFLCTIRGNHRGIYLRSSQNVTIGSCKIRKNDHNGIEIYKDCHDFLVTGCFVRHGSKHGIRSDDSGWGIIGNSNVSHNSLQGIRIIWQSNKNLIHACEFAENSGYGVYVKSDADITWIWENNFFNNNGGNTQGYSGTTDTEWDNSVHNGDDGNHWDDHTSPDNNSDGIVDDPYVVDGGQSEEDEYPKVGPYSGIGP